MEDDLKILEMKKKKLDEEHQNIYEEYYVNGKQVKFSQHYIFNKRVSIMLPDSFVNMPDKVAKFKYPNENRPQIIKTNMLGDVNFTFNVLKSRMTPEQVAEMTKETCNILKRYQPMNTFFEDKILATQMGEVGFFDFKSLGLDYPLYNVVFLMSIKGRPFQGGFNCKLSDMEKWKSAVIQVIESIRLVEEI